MTLAQEFKSFILRGKVVDLAVGVAVGGAFTKVIDSLVKEVVMPVVGYFMNGIDFSQHRLILKAANTKLNLPELAIYYGNFANAIFTFILVGFVVFSFIKLLNRLHIEEEKTSEAAKEVQISNQLLVEIRDLLARKE